MNAKTQGQKKNAKTQRRKGAKNFMFFATWRIGRLSWPVTYITGHRLVLTFFLLILLPVSMVNASEAETILSQMQKRYGSVETISGSFRIIHRDLGIEQMESGQFKLKKPARMRWEYDNSEGKLFIADGTESYLYMPKDNQVTVESLTASDLQRTPLRFLLGGEGLDEIYFIQPESVSESRFEGTQAIRLIPKENDPDYAYLILEIDRETHDLRRLMLREHSGSSTEYIFSDMKTNEAFQNKIFKFKIPKGAEVLRMETEEIR